MILDQLITGDVKTEIQYRRAVKEEGNGAARRILDEVFEPADSRWRGLGMIPKAVSSFGRSIGVRRDDAVRRS